MRAAYAVLVEQPITSISSATSSNPPLATPVALPGGASAAFANALNQVRAGGSTLFPTVASNSLTNVASLRPDLIGDIRLHPTGEPTVWFNNLVCDPRSAATCPAGAAFAAPISGANVFHFGSLGRNAVIGPAFNNTDFSVVKKTRLSEDKTIEFRAEFFDLFNHTNFGQPGRVAQFGSTTFGVINSTRFTTGDSGSSRQVQFALKFLF